MNEKKEARKPVSKKPSSADRAGHYDLDGASFDERVVIASDEVTAEEDAALKSRNGSAVPQ